MVKSTNKLIGMLENKELYDSDEQFDPREDMITEDLRN